MNKCLITLSLITTLINGCFTGGQNIIDNNTSVTENDIEICVYNTDELTAEMLEHREGKLIIERFTGYVIDDEKNGYGDDGSYISYKSVDCQNGDVIVSYFIYNPYTNYIDDIIDRFDFIQKEKE